MIINKENKGYYKLCGTHEKMREILEGVGEYEYELNKNYFEVLVQNIVSQQISTSAAESIWKRVKVALVEITPQTIMESENGKLRGLGIPKTKEKYIRDLCEKVVSKEVDLDSIDGLSDEAVINMLTTVKGIGNWTAEMFLMFSLGRPDVFSTLDLGIRKGVATILKINHLPSWEEMDRIKRLFSPYGTIASLYIWKAQELGLLKYKEK